MLEDEKPPYINRTSGEEEEEEQEEIEDQNQIQNNPQEQNINSEEPIENIAYQQPLNQSPYKNEDNNDVEDILKKTSLNEDNDNDNENDNNDEQININQSVKPPIVQEIINNPIIQNMEQPISISNINENPIYNSYSYSIPKTINNNDFTTNLGQNENNIFATVQPLNTNTQTIISSDMTTQYENNDINNINNINNNYMYQPNEAFNINNYNNTTELINQFPQYGQYDQNLINTTPLPGMPNIINDYSTQSNNIIYSSYNPNDINNFQNHAQVVHIDEERMKNPEVKKYVEESEQHINNYISQLKKPKLSKNNNNKDNKINDFSSNNSINKKNDFSNNNSVNKKNNNNSINSSFSFKNNNKSFNNNNNIKNKNINNSIQNSQSMNKENYNTNNLKGCKNKNLNSSSYLNPKKLEDFKKFSPEFYINFYNNDDYFFAPIKSRDIKHEQTLKNPIKNEIYQGDINSKNQKHGFGFLISSDKKRIGTWKNDKFNGWGREINSNGEIYEGRFENDKLNGKGIYKIGGEMYIGDFQNYRKHGKGELFTNSYHYVGDFVNDTMKGNGRIEYYDEGVFEGNFNNDEINGYGIYKYKNGDFYEGQMKNGYMNGKGKLTKTNGEIFEGLFINNEYQNEQNDTYRRNQPMYSYND